MGTQLPLLKKGRSPQFSAHVYCGQTAGWIKMALDMEVGLGPGHIVLDGDPALPPQKGGTAPPIFSPFLLWPNCWMHQDATCYGGRPQPRPLCGRWDMGTQLPPQKMGGAQPHQFLAHVYCGQTAGWIKMPFGTKVDLTPATLC